MMGTERDDRLNANEPTAAPVAASSRVRSWVTLVAAMLVIALAGAWLTRSVPEGPRRDPDRYYHLAISRMMADHGRLDALPQVTGLGWDERFPDKEFLFHVVTTLGYAAAGEAGVIASTQLLALIALWLLLVALARWVRPLRALLVVALVAGLSPDFLVRMMLVRPHLIAVLAFAALLLALFSRRASGCAAAGAVYALGYHAVYMPLALIGVAAIVAGRSDRAMLRAAAGGAAGVGVGIVVNPYFPANIAMGWTHLRIALGLDVAAALRYGDELVPHAADVWLRHYLMPTALFLAAVLNAPRWLVTERGARRSPPDPPTWTDYRILLLASAMFLAASMQNPRAVEYLIPCVALLAGVMLHASNPLRRINAVAFAVFAVALGVPRLARFVTEPPARHAAMASVLAAVERIPASASGSLVFNSEWSRTPPLMWARPDLRFLDILDPSFLHEHDPNIATLRESFNAGTLADPFHAIHDVVGARYVLTQQEAAVEQMEASLGFVRIFPDDYADVANIHETMFLYELLPPATDPFVRRFDVGAMPPVPDDRFRELSPSAGERFMRVQAGLPEPAFLDLRALGLPKADGGQTECAVVRAPPPELARFDKATFVGVGGGRNARLYVNGEPVFSSVRAFLQPRTLAVLVPLPRPLEATDTVELLVCSGARSPYHGAALSFWTQAAIDDICRAKGRNSLDAPSGATPWRYAVQRRTCLGPVAAPLGLP